MEQIKFIPKEQLFGNIKHGVYFISESDVSTFYFIEICEGKFEDNVIMKIYSMDYPSNHFDMNGLVNGSEIGIYENDIVLLCEINLCSKYFFPVFKNDMQLYYDKEKYYKGDYKTNSITSLMECINYAIEYGLNKSKIKPY